MRRSWMTMIATIAAAVSFGSSAAAANPHPNIVYIISDDQGPPRLDMTVYPYLPRAHVTMTSAKTYMSLLAGASS